MVPEDPSIDVVVVSWNVREDLVGCVESVLASKGVHVRVVVVDNASADGSANAVAAGFPDVALIRNSTNTGFAHAANQGLAAGHAPWVFLLNPDCVVPPDAIARLTARLRGLPGHAMVVPRLVDGSGQPQHSVHRFPSLLDAALLATGADHLLGRRTRAHLLREGAWDSAVERDVPWAIGAAMLLRRSAVDHVGLLDDGFFMYAEDLEWCDRFRSAGYRIRFVPDVTITHLGNRSGAQRYGSRRTQAWMESTVRFARRRHGLVWTSAFVGINGGAVSIRLAWSQLADRARPSPQRHHNRAFWADHARFYRGLAGAPARRRSPRGLTGHEAAEPGERRRFLVVGTNYPPLSLGGYELLCRDHVASLREQGHEVTVLTSRHGLTPARSHEEAEEVGESGETVLRVLDFRWDAYRLVRPGGLALLRSERRQRRLVERVVRRARPDAAVVWHLAAMSKSVLSVLHAQGVPTMLMVEEPWPVWDIDGDPWIRLWRDLRERRRTRLPSTPLRLLADRVVAPTDVRPALRAATPVYASAYLRDVVEEGREELRGRGDVVHNGIDAALFATGHADDAPLRDPVQLLYAGRVERRKGVHTAVETLGAIRAAGLDARLSIVGWRDAAYEAELEALADELGVAGFVAWSDPVDRARMGQRYGAADIVLFPTIWPEPFGLVPLEAMAAGCLVVATGTGGSGEFLHDGRNCLLFTPERAEEAAARVQRLAGDPELVARLRCGARATVAEHSLEGYIAGLDAALWAAMGQPPPR